MAVASARVGRPYHMADIDFSKDPELPLRDAFVAACATLRYFDTVVLSRTLGVDVVTVRRWKAGLCFPARRGSAQYVIKWVQDGKPRKVLTQAEINQGIL